MIPPSLRPAASPARSPGLLLRDRRFGLCLTGKPPRVHLPHVVGDSARFLLWHYGIGLRWRLRQLTGRHDDKAHFLLGAPSLTVLALDAAADAGPMPTARLFGLGPPGLLHQEGPDRGLAPICAYLSI
jgi:hypothetical protein